MSSMLVWKPVVAVGGSLPDALKYVLREMAQNDGGAADSVITHEDLDKLEGMRLAGVEGAKELIDLVNEHGSVEVTEDG